MEILSEDVNVVERSTPTSLVISDRRDNIKEILRVLGRLDRPAPQLNIAVKLIETNINDDDNLGIDWPESYSGTLGGLLDEETGLTHLGVYPLEGGDWVWGKFSANEVRLALDVLMERRDSRLLSDPNITTISNKPAEIAVTTTIPIQTVNRFTEGAVIQDIVTFQELDVGITLRVTGRINEDSIITLKVNPIIEEITGFTGPPDNQRPITSNRSMFTEVRVNNNETLVMGGLLRESTFENVKKLPLLGSIPGIGLLFQHHSTQKEKTDLTIFITPRIIDESMAQK
jgi:general secretion pathway protein D